MLWWRYEDWHNDIYTVTETTIIDRESLPFGFREQKRVGSLQDIESVYSRVPNFLAKVINLGDVIIDTASSPSTPLSQFTTPLPCNKRSFREYMPTMNGRVREKLNQR